MGNIHFIILKYSTSDSQPKLLYTIQTNQRSNIIYTMIITRSISVFMINVTVYTQRYDKIYLLSVQCHIFI